METLKLIVNFNNQYDYKPQIIKEVDCLDNDDVYSIMTDANRYENDGNVKSVTVQHYIDGKYCGNLKFWETDLICSYELTVNILDLYDYE